MSKREREFNLDSYTSDFYSSNTTKFTWFAVDKKDLLRAGGYGLGVTLAGYGMVTGATATADYIVAKIDSKVSSHFAVAEPMDISKEYPELVTMLKEKQHDTTGVHTSNAKPAVYKTTVKSMGQDYQKEHYFNAQKGRQVLRSLRGLPYTQNNSKIAKGLGVDCSSLVKKYVEGAYDIKGFPRSADMQFAYFRASNKLWRDKEGDVVNGELYDNLDILKELPNGAIVYFSKKIKGGRHVHHVAVKFGKKGDFKLYQAFKSGYRVKEIDMSQYFGGRADRRIEGVVIPEAITIKQGDFYTNEGLALYDINFKKEYRNRIKYLNGKLGLTTMTGVEV